MYPKLFNYGMVDFDSICIDGPVSMYDTETWVTKIKYLNELLGVRIRQNHEIKFNQFDINDEPVYVESLFWPDIYKFERGGFLYHDKVSNKNLVMLDLRVKWIKEHSFPVNRLLYSSSDFWMNIFKTLEYGNCFSFDSRFYSTQIIDENHLNFDKVVLYFEYTYENIGATIEKCNQLTSFFKMSKHKAQNINVIVQNKRAYKLYSETILAFYYAFLETHHKVQFTYRFENDRELKINWNYGWLLIHKRENSDKLSNKFETKWVRVKDLYLGLTKMSKWKVVDYNYILIHDDNIPHEFSIPDELHPCSEAEYIAEKFVDSKKESIYFLVQIDEITSTEFVNPLFEKEHNVIGEAGPMNLYDLVEWIDKCKHVSIDMSAGHDVDNLFDYGIK